MATATIKNTLASVETLADLLERLGGVPPERIRYRPLPGKATERDVIAAYGLPQKLLCELIDGVLVEKAMGVKASYIAMLLGYYLLTFLERKGLGGIVLGADGFIQFRPGLVFIPDVSYFSEARLLGEELRDEAIATIIPDLAIEVLSPSNTKREIQNKLREFFAAGVRLAWVIDPKTASAEVYTSATECKHLTKSGTLDGGEVLPGFNLPLRKLFAPKTSRKSR